MDLKVEVIEEEQENNRNNKLLSILDKDKLKKVEKESEDLLKQLNIIKDNITLANKRYQEISQMNLNKYYDDLQYKNNLITIHNKCLNYANQKGVQFWKSYDNSNIYYRKNKFSKKYKLNRDKELFNLLGIHVKIYDSIDQVKLVNNNTLILIADYFTLIKDEIFDLHNDLEWVSHNNFQYKNTFQYNSFLKKRIKINQKRKIEMELLFPNNIPYPTFIPNFVSGPFLDQNIPIELYPFSSVSNEIEFLNPNIYNQLQSLNQELEIKTSIIKDFIEYFSKDNYQFNYIMNWLAYFFQKLNKSSRALVLIGDKGTTDILINNIIKPIFAYKEEYFSIIDDETLEKSYETIIKNKIFYHIDELSISKINDKRTSNILLKLIKPNASNFNQVIENNYEYIYGETIITSSYESPSPFLKDSYSSCSVFSIKHMDTILKKFKMDRLSFEERIQNDLSNFSNILATYALDKNYFFIAETEEKNILPCMKKGILLTKLLKKQIQEFIQAIKEKNLKYFSPIKLDDDKSLYKELLKNFDDDAIYQPKLSAYFNIVYGDIIFQNNSDFIEILKEEECLFNQVSDDKFKSNGLRRYKIYDYKLSSGYKGKIPCQSNSNRKDSISTRFRF